MESCGKGFDWVIGLESNSSSSSSKKFIALEGFFFFITGLSIYT